MSSTDPQKPRRRRTGPVIGGLIGLAVVIAGAVAAVGAGALPAPSWIGAAHPSSASGSHPATTTGASATAQAAAPKSAPATPHAVDCDDLLSPATVAGVMGAGAQLTPADASPAPTDDPSSTVGALQCRWENVAQVAALTVIVTPAAIADETAYSAAGYVKIGELPDFGADAADWRTESGGVIVDVPMGDDRLEVSTNGFVTAAAPGDAIGPALTVAHTVHDELTR